MPTCKQNNSYALLFVTLILLPLFFSLDIQEQKNAGSAALWNNLPENAWKFTLDDKDHNSLAIVVTSLKDILGTATFSAEEFIKVPRTDSGVLKVCCIIELNCYQHCAYNMCC